MVKGSTNIKCVVLAFDETTFHKMSKDRRTVAVIGAGQTGLVSMKVLQENGFAVQGFEMNSDIGGLWNFSIHGKGNKAYEETSNSSEPLATSYSTLRMNTSVWSSVYSDFPPKEGTYDEFLTHAQFMRYLKSYAHKHRLQKNIKFNCTVAKLEKTVSPVGWDIHYIQDGRSGLFHVDFVLVASGMFRYQHVPHISGLDQFSGQLIQSNQVRNPGALFRDKTVLILGGSVTGADLACNALKSNAKKVYLSVSSRPNERSRWFVDRYPDGSPCRNPLKEIHCGDDSPPVNHTPKVLPWDMQISRFKYYECNLSYVDSLKHHMQPFVMKSAKPERGVQDCEMEVFEPDVKRDAWMVADTKTLTQEMTSGALVHIGVVSDIQGNSVSLTDGTAIDNVNVLVIATGFVKRFPFLDDVWSTEDQRKFHLYNHMILLQEELDGIAFAGMTGAPVGVFVIAEMQARWIAKVWENRTYDSNSHFYSETERITMTEHVRSLLCTGIYNFIRDPFLYLDNLAAFVGCLPLCSSEDFSTAIEEADGIEEVELAVALWHGPFTSAQYQVKAKDRRIRSRARNTVTSVAKKYLGEAFDKYVKFYAKSTKLQ